MDLEFSPEQIELQRSVREVLVRECPIGLAREAAERGTEPAEPWGSAVRLGWPAVAIPETCGGLGLGAAELGLVIEAHGEALAPGPLLTTTALFAPVLLEAASPEQRERWLGALAAGALTGTLALQPAAGPGERDPLCARRDGGGFVLDGSCAFVLGAGRVDAIVAVARVDEGDGTGLFLLSRDEASLEPVVSLDTTRPFAHLRCAGLRIPAERGIGAPGACAPALERALDFARAMLALEIVGLCEALLQRSLGHARQRIQFGRPIGSFQAIQHKCVDLFIALEKARSLAYFALAAIDDDDPRRSLACAMAKAAAGDCQRLVAKEAIQIHGGTGFTWECDVHLFVKRAMSDAALLGDSRAQRARVADLLHF